MHFTKPDADFLVPDAAPMPGAVSRTTHLGVGAHADDLEFMAYHGIEACYKKEDRWFGGVTCTDGAGSSRTGPFANFTDAQMVTARMEEQRSAARIGQYGFMAQLAYTSSDTKEEAQLAKLVHDLEKIFRLAQPEVVYTHNPFDKHPTHVVVFLSVLAAIRRLPAELRPRELLGCEVWRDLDWLPDHLKVIQPLDNWPDLAPALNAVFASQIAGGKRYDQAVEGRRRANATFQQAYSSDQYQRVALAIDLRPLILDDTLAPEVFASHILGAFADEVLPVLKQ